MEQIDVLSIFFLILCCRCVIFPYQRSISIRKLEIKAADKKATYLTAKSSLLSIPYIMYVCGKMMNALARARSTHIQYTYIQLLFFINPYKKIFVPPFAFIEPRRIRIRSSTFVPIYRSPNRPVVYNIRHYSRH